MLFQVERRWGEWMARRIVSEAEEKGPMTHI